VIVDCAIYQEGERRAGPASLEEAYQASQSGQAFVWIGLYEPSPAEFDSLQREFDLHDLAVEDAIKAHQRPKLEVYDGTIFLVVKTARYADHEEVVEFGEILIFLGEGFIITVRHGEASSLHDVRLALEKDHDKLRCGTGAVLYAILDRVVDDYQPAMDGLAQDVEEVEAEVFSSARRNPAERIYKLKREVLEFSHSVSPLIDPCERLTSGQFEVVHPDIQEYFRDVVDHLIRVNEQIESYRDLLTSILSANLTQVGVRQNEDMRKISAWVAIAAVPTAIAAIYGMNFEHMPELTWSFGYPAVLLVMVLLCSVLYWRLRRAGWL
jgi:magnesium transporter